MMKMYLSYLRALIGSKKGQGMVEYGLIISLIAVACIAALIILGPSIADLFTEVSETITGEPTP
ncbi:UNVERIFIED_CONTAM: pilus assembly protein Flp/PilA [Acetivibrio alkalicellulosi]